MTVDGMTSRWIDDLAQEDGEERTPRRQRPRRGSRLLLLAAAVPWIIVIALLVLPPRLGATEDDVGPSPDGQVPHDPQGGSTATEGSANGEPDASDAGGSRPDNGAQADPSEVDGGGLESPLHLLELRGSWRVEPGAEEAAALAAVVARSWLTTLDPPLDLPGLPAPTGRSYAEHLVVEAVERHSPDVAIVTVLAVVLEGDDDLEARVRRLAVPIVWDDDGPRPGGEPWALPAPTLAAESLESTEVTDPAEHLVAVAALEAAGFVDVELVALGDTGAGPLIAEVRAATPDGALVNGPVWLRRHLDGLVVAGTPMPAGTNEPAAPPDPPGPAAETDRGPVEAETP